MRNAIVGLTHLYHHSDILSVLPDAYNAGHHSDVTFFCKDGNAKAHRLLLGSVSPFLQKLFNEQKFRDMVDVYLPDTELEDLDNLLRYLYEGFIRLDHVEFSKFKILKKTLGLNIVTSISTHQSQNEDADEDEEEDEDKDRTDDDPVLPEKHQDNTVDQKSQCGTTALRNNGTQATMTESSFPGLKSKISPPENTPKILNMDSGLDKTTEESVIHSLNNLIKQFSASWSESELSTNKSAKQSKGPAPLLVPLENLKKVVETIEKRKAESNIENIVMKCVAKVITLQQDRIVKEVLQKFKIQFDQIETKTKSSNLTAARNAPDKAIDTDDEAGVNSDASTVSLGNSSHIAEENLVKAVNGTVPPKSQQIITSFASPVTPVSFFSKSKKQGDSLKDIDSPGQSSVSQIKEISSKVNVNAAIMDTSNLTGIPVAQCAPQVTQPSVPVSSKNLCTQSLPSTSKIMISGISPLTSQKPSNTVSIPMPVKSNYIPVTQLQPAGNQQQVFILRNYGSGSVQIPSLHIPQPSQGPAPRRISAGDSPRKKLKLSYGFKSVELSSSVRPATHDSQSLPAVSKQAPAPVPATVTQSPVTSVGHIITTRAVAPSPMLQTTNLLQTATVTHSQTSFQLLSSVQSTPSAAYFVPLSSAVLVAAPQQTVGGQTGASSSTNNTHTGASVTQEQNSTPIITTASDRTGVESVLTRKQFPHITGPHQTQGRKVVKK